jgi:two-component system, OmpR family, sensor histidine kinase BaeS
VGALRRLGLRARLTIALVATAVLAVGTATMLSNLGLPSRVTDAAEARLTRQTTHLAAVAAVFYAEEGRWTDEDLLAVEHLAAMSNLRVELARVERARPLDTLPPGFRDGPTATAPVVVGGRRVGILTAQPAGRTLLTPEEEHLRHSLDRLHLAAGGVSVVAALALAFVLAQGLAAPLRRIRRGAEELAAGHLDVRVVVDGGPELDAVAGALNALGATLAHEEQLRKASVADLAHELRTPVNGLLGRIEAALDGVLEPEANLAAMHGEAVRLTRLLDDLASLADAEQPGLLFDKEEVDLARLVRAAADRWRIRLAERGLTLEAATAPAPVVGDPARLTQVIDNLLENALRYTEPGGLVKIRTATDGDEAVLEVADTGIGVAATDLPHLFKRFWRGERSRSRATGGAGIGLAIVAELVRAHEGRIEVDSEPGVGSTFRVLVPASVRRPAAGIAV